MTARFAEYVDRAAWNEGSKMHNEFTAIVEQDDEWYIVYCPEIPGTNGQGKTKQEALASLAEAIELILQDRREDALPGLFIACLFFTTSLWVKLCL